MLDIKAQITGVSVDYVRQMTSVTIATHERPDAFNDLLDTDLSVKMGKYREKRSLDANAYAWVLMDKIAQAQDMQTSKDDVYEEMLKRYGTFYKDEQGYIVITLKASVDVDKLDGHWRFVKESNGFKSYMMIKGSSQYDTAEMSRFIDGIVYEAKALGIQTETPDEIERLKVLWQRNCGQS